METCFSIAIAGKEHLDFVPRICDEIADSAQKRGTGISRRKPEDLVSKILAGKAIIATLDGEWAGFCYIESWDNDRFVSNSGLIVAPPFRKLGLATMLKSKAVELAQIKFPHARIFGLTTSAAVMKINSDLGFKPVVYSSLPQDEPFWQGCKSCVNYHILQSKERRNCLCTAMLLDPEKESKVLSMVNFQFQTA